METLILSANNQYARPQRGRSERAAPGLSSWQGNEYGCGFLSRQSSSDLSDPMYDIGRYYMPVQQLPYGFHSTTEEHFFFATSVAESQIYRSNNIKYPAAPTRHCNSAFSKIDNELEGRVLGMQGCRSVSPVHGWTASYEIITGQVICRYSSSGFDGKISLQAIPPKMDGFVATASRPIARGGSLELFAKRSPDTVGPAALSSMHRPKSNTNGSKIISKGRLTSTRESNSCKESDIPVGGGIHIPAGGGVCSKDGAANSFGSRRGRLANKFPRGGITSDNNGAALVSMEGGQEEERYCICTSEGKGTLSCYRSSSESNIFEDHGSGLMPIDPIVTSVLGTPLTVEGCTQGSSQSALSPSVNERWAGPAFSNSPPPSSLPLPTFTRREIRTSSLEIPQAEAEFVADAISISALGTPNRSFSLPSVGTFQSHLDINHATKGLRRLLNLDSDT